MVNQLLSTGHSDLRAFICKDDKELEQVVTEVKQKSYGEQADSMVTEVLENQVWVEDGNFRWEIENWDSEF